jgi:hypothetical protein
MESFPSAPIVCQVQKFGLREHEIEETLPQIDGIPAAMPIAVGKPDSEDAISSWSVGEA